MRINTRNISQALYCRSAYLRYTEFPTKDDVRPLTFSVGAIVWLWLKAHRSRHTRGREALLDENSGSRRLGSARFRFKSFLCNVPLSPRDGHVRPMRQSLFPSLLIRHGVQSYGAEQWREVSRQTG